MKNYYVYIMASRRYGTLYIGITHNLIKRAYEHREGIVDGFTKTYKVKLLVHYEQFNDVQDAIAREKQLKHWNRQWKINLIEECNASWCDLYPSIVE